MLHIVKWGITSFNMVPTALDKGSPSKALAAADNILGMTHFKTNRKEKERQGEAGGKKIY